MKRLLWLILVASSFAQTFSHVVIVVQENRTPDNLFGSSPNFEPGVDIASSGLTKSKPVPLTPVPLDNCYDLGHAHRSFLLDYNGGQMNGFGNGGQAACAGPNPQAYRYVDNTTGTVQPYFDLAMQYGFANRMFQTNQGDSFPAHQFLISGTSAPSDTSSLFVADNPANPAFSGCTSPATVAVELIDPEGNYTKAFPCFDRSTLIDRVEDAGLTWRYYSANAIWNAPNAISSICVPKSVDGKLVCSGSEWSLDSKTSKVLSDITKCNLPNIAWITPTAVNSDHAGDNKAGGPSWVASIVNAIGTSSCGYWQNTAILVTWDDWGGWYDHVPPPQIGQSNGWGQSYVYGFRVPLLVVSAYTPAGYVSNVTHDFGSLLRFVESNFDLRLIGPGTFADSYADDLADFFTLNSSRPFKVIPAQYDADHFINEPESLDNPDND